LGLFTFSNALFFIKYCIVVLATFEPTYYTGNFMTITTDTSKSGISSSFKKAALKV
jgi:hypothetical protein